MGKAAVLTKDNNRSRKPRIKRERELNNLEKLVFGDPTEIFNGLDEKPLPKKKRKKSKLKASAQTDEAESNKEKSDDIKSLKPAWEDEDDLNTSIATAHTLQGRPGIDHPLQPSDAYSSLLKQRFENIVGNAEWANLNRKKDDEDENELLQTVGNSFTKGSQLLPNVINVNTLRNLNSDTMCEGKVIKSVEFHPKSSVALVAGLSGIASLFEVDGKHNPTLHSIKFPKFNIHCARFSHDGNHFIVGSQHGRNYYSYDMMSGRNITLPLNYNIGFTNMQRFEVSPDGKIIACCGRFGAIILLSAKTKEWLCTLKMNKEVRSICFNSDGSQMYSHGDDGKVYVWNMNTRQCIHTFSDDGCLKGTSICISPCDRLLACGSSSGVVNLYDASTVLNNESPKPLKIIFNLTTAVTSLKFNHSSEILAIASVKAEKAFRLMNYPSMTVYKNFPDLNKSTGLINCVNFSPHSGFLAYGNNFGRVPLYRLNHFGNF